MAPRVPVHKPDDDEHVDPYLAPGAGAKDPGVVNGVVARLKQKGFTMDGKRIHLREPRAGEVGPEVFFFGSQTACVILAALLWACGALPTFFVDGATLEAGWIARIFVRNYVLMVIMYGGYHMLFYNGYYRVLFGAAPHKFQPAPPEPGQTSRDVFYTTLSMTWVSMMEVFAVYGWAQGWFPGAYRDLAARPLEAAALATAIAFGNDLHFWLVHRALHWPPLYKSVHKLHHRSKNPGPWSGMSMHPVEGIAYVSRILLPLAVSHHPLHFYFSMLNTVLMPVPGHSGFEELLGSEYHNLHHLLFAVNFGSPAAPLDWLFGCQVHIDRERTEADPSGGSFGSVGGKKAAAAGGGKKAA